MLPQMLEAYASEIRFPMMTTKVSFSQLTTMVSNGEAGAVNGDGGNGTSATEDRSSRKDREAAHR